MQELDTKEIQDVSLEILKKITDVCEQFDLRYYLIYGTLIGAIRHKGFIPWDDDLDIMMPRPDYERLLNYLRENKIKDLTVFNHKTHVNYPYMITRISDDRYHIEAENEQSVGMGVFIDIYPFDGLGDTREEALGYGLKGDRLSSFCFQASRRHFSLDNTTSLVRKILKFPVYLISRLIGKDFFQKKIEALAGRFEYDESRYVGCFVWLSGGWKDIFERAWFDEFEMCPFGVYEFRVPKEYDKVLRHIYGDYMKLPPEKDRVGHHFYKAYRKDS